MHSMSLVLLSSLVVAAAAEASATCSTGLDCSLNGECVSGSCVCSPAWTGSTCGSLNLKPALLSNGYGYPGSSSSSWGAGVELDPVSGLYFMAVDEMTRNCGLGTWQTNSHCILAVSPNASGPYSKVQTLMDSFCHGSSLSRDPASNTFVFNHMASSAPATQCYQCFDGVTPANSTKGPCTTGGIVPYSGAAFYGAPKGPYTVSQGWEDGGNCEAFIVPNGTVIWACPYGGPGASNCSGATSFLTIFVSPSLDAALAGNRTMLPRVIHPSGACVNWEDQNLWMDASGNLHSIFHAWRGQNTSYPAPGCYRNASGAWLPAGCTSLGGHTFSPNGIDWYVSPVPAYTSSVTYEDGSVLDFRARERPHLILSPAGDPLWFISAVGDPGPGGNTGVGGADHTFTLIQQLGA